MPFTSTVSTTQNVGGMTPHPPGFDCREPTIDLIYRTSCRCLGWRILCLHQQCKSQLPLYFSMPCTHQFQFPDLRRQHLALHVHICESRYRGPVVARRVDLVCGPSSEKHSAHYTTILHARSHTMEHLFLLH